MAAINFRIRPAGWIYLLADGNPHAQVIFMEAFHDFFGAWLGLGSRPEQLTVVQVVSRAVIIFIIALTFVRLGHKRSLARKTAFDTALVVIFGAILARAVNGSGPFVPSIAAGAVLVLLHRLLASIAYHWEGFDRLIKGRPDILLNEGDFLPKKMRRHKISREDIFEDMRLRGHPDAGAIAAARLERSGDISFIPQEKVR
jgi:uncharacterized membrane protein YcaP (DUF421 family)